MTDHTTGGSGGYIGSTVAQMPAQMPMLGGPKAVSAMPIGAALAGIDWVSVAAQAVAFIESPQGQQFFKMLEEGFVALRVVATNTPHLLEPVLGAIVSKLTGHTLAPAPATP